MTAHQAGELDGSNHPNLRPEPPIEQRRSALAAPDLRTVFGRTFQVVAARSKEVRDRLLPVVGVMTLVVVLNKGDDPPLPTDLDLRAEDVVEKAHGLSESKATSSPTLISMSR